MDKATIHSGEMAYEIAGTGEPVLLIHCSFVADGFRPLLAEPRLSERYQLINVHRRGYGQNERVMPPYSLEDQANDLLELLAHLNVPKAHIVGHSFGANIALQMALTAPDTVHSLVLAEPPITFLMSPEALGVIGGAIGQAVGQYSAGDKEGAMTTWLNGAFGPGWQAIAERAVPGVYAQILNDVDAAIAVDGGALQAWPVGPDQIRQLTQPVLSVFHVDPYWNGFQDVHQGLLGLLPRTKSLVIPNASHLLQLQNPRSVAEGLDSFFTRQPIKASQRV